MIPRRFVIFVSLILAGCATNRAGRPVARAPATRPANPVALAPATRPTLDRKATLTLDQIDDRPVLPLRPTTAPAAAALPAPLDALALYAKARDALAANQRFNAVNLLERAIEIDPYSAELQRTLGRAYLASGNTAKAITALQSASALDPSHLRTHTSLGRLYLTRNDSARALTELRLAVQTPDYADQRDEAGAAIADFFLARALRQEGYDRAAFDQYQSVLKRLERRTLAMRSDPELNDWAARPEAILAEVGRIAERLGEWEAALAAWQAILQNDDDHRADDNLDVEKHVIENLITLGRADEALRESAASVRRTGASARSLELLRDTSRRVGNERAAFDEMRKLQRERPNDRALLFALADLLDASDRAAEAEQLLSDAVRPKYDVDVIRKLFNLYSQRKRASDAAILLIESASARPGIAGEMSDMFAKLQRPARADTLRASDVEKLQVPASAEGAKAYFVADAALRGGRDQMARDALDRATRAKPSFPPALIAAISRVPSRADLDDAGKAKLSAELIAIAEQSGERGPALAEAMRAVELAARGKRPEAAESFERAIKLGGTNVSADVLLAYADVQYSLQNAAKFEQTLWRVVSDYPTNVGAYLRLFAYQMNREKGVGAATMNVLQRWLANDPSSVEARLRQAQVLAQSRGAQQQEGVRIVGDLARSRSNEIEVFAVARDVYDTAGNKELYQQLLEELHARDPSNLTVADALVEAYEQDKRTDDALRVLDTSRAAVANEPKAMYYLSALFARLQRKDIAQQVLEGLLKIAPDDPAANNDLGYTWADEGMNLERAEKMCRRAVEAEPDNASFLDSLGWVLYKRGRFDEARKHLESAASAGDLATDPVTLDHLGDTLYRMNQNEAAGASWRRSKEKIRTSGVTRPDWETLAATLDKKIEQIDAGGVVDVAPLAAGAAGEESGQPPPRTSIKDARAPQPKPDN